MIFLFCTAGGLTPTTPIRDTMAAPIRDTMAALIRDTMTVPIRDTMAAPIRDTMAAGVDTPIMGRIFITGFSFSHRNLVCLRMLDFPLYSSLIGGDPAEAASGCGMADADWLDSPVI